MTEKYRKVECAVDLFGMTAEEIDEISNTAKDYAIYKGIAIRSQTLNSDARVSVPFCVVPSPFPTKEFNHAKKIQMLMNCIIHKVAHDKEFLYKCLENTIKNDSFTANIWKIYETVENEDDSSLEPISLGLIRSDYMLDTDSHDNVIGIKQIESNVIATSFSGLASSTTQLHRFVLDRLRMKEKIKKLPKNDSLHEMAKGLVTAWDLYGKKSAWVLVVVEDVTYNICDQRATEFAVCEIERNIHIMRCTFSNLRTSAVLDGKTLFVDKKEVAVVYYRHGYTPESYEPEKSSTTVRFFERNDYFTVHGSDAVFVAKEVFKTLSVIKMIGSDSHKTESVIVSKQNFESLVRDLLLLKQYRVEIYQNKSPGKKQDWSLEYKASPGNLTQLEDILFSGSSSLVESKGVIAVKVKSNNKEQVIGIAFGDPVLREFIVSEFSDNAFFSEFEAVLVHLSPKECLLSPVGSDSQEEIKNIIKRNNILLSECKAGDFNATDITQDLQRLLKSDSGDKVKSLKLSEVDSKMALQCVAALIKCFELLSDETNFGQFILSSFHPQQYMRLDISAVKALGIVPTSLDDIRNHSLLGLLNKCRTPQGQRLLTQWIKQPLMDVKKIEERLDIVESLVSDTELRQSLHDNLLRRIPDLQILSTKFQKKKCNLQDVYKVYTVAIQLPNLFQCLSKHTGPHMNALKGKFCTDIKDRMLEFKDYIEMVKTVIDLDAVESGEFIIKSDCDSKLQEIRKLMTKLQKLMTKELDQVANELGLEANKTVKLENCKMIGFYFRVTRKDEKALRGRKNFYTIDTKQNGVRFFNSTLKDYNEKYQSLRKSYEKYQEELVSGVISTAATYCLPMKLLGETIAHLDVLVSFSSLAFSAPKPYVRPKILPKGSQGIILKQARHPCLEFQPDVDFIPNDIEMKKGHHIFHVITGPNMGGKSTFIRSVALNVIMAQIGSFVACEYAEISIVDAILTRIGASDRPLKGVSTFMAEMLEMKNILNTATADSLIIVDELGRGTSTDDGFRLSWSISRYIAVDLKSYCLFTTHFHELACLADNISSMNNLHVTAVTSEDNITFLYKVKPGACQESFGIHVAEMANLGNEVILFAKEQLHEIEKKSLAQGYQEKISKLYQKIPLPIKRKVLHDDNEEEFEGFMEELKKTKFSKYEYWTARIPVLQKKVNSYRSSAELFHFHERLSNDLKAEEERFVKDKEFSN